MCAGTYPLLGRRVLGHVVCAGLSVIGSDAIAQPARAEVIGDVPACRACGVQLSAVTTIRSSRAAEFGRASKPYVLRDGRVVVAPLTRTDQAAVFTAAGALVAKLTLPAGSDGRTGGRIVRVRQGPGDSVWFVDAMRGEIHVASPALKFARRVRPGGRLHDVAPLQGGDAIIAALVPTRAEAGTPLRRVGPDGAVIASFGRPVIAAPGSLELITVTLAQGAGGSVWAVATNDYTLTRWSARGAELQRIVRRSAWFTPWQSGDSVPPWLARPVPKLKSVQADDAGRVWALSIVPSRQWRGEQPAVHHESGEQDEHVDPRSPAVGQVGQFVERQIEAFDLRTGKLLLSQRLPGAHLDFAGPNALYSLAPTPRSTLDVVIWRVTPLLRGE
jgi:hypothetical protein